MFKIIDKNKITVSGNKLTYTPSFNNNHIKVIRSVLLFDTSLLEQVTNLEVKINDLVVDNIQIDSNNKKEKICIDITDELNDILRNGDNSLIVTLSNLTSISTDESNYEVITNYNLTKETQNNTYQDVSVKRAGNGKINLSTGELKFIHSDLNLGSNILDMNVSHIYNTFNENCSIDKVCTKSGEIELPKSYTGKGWKLSTEQYLVKERPNNELLDEDVSSNYTYVNADGNHILFQEKYYYEKDGEKFYLSPNMIYVDDNGNLKYREDTINYDVKSEIITNSDYVLIPKAEGFNDLKKIEQDTNEIATLRDQIEAYKDEINNLEDEINNTAEKISELKKITNKYGLSVNSVKQNDNINNISQELQNVNYYIQKKTSDNDVNTKTLQKNYNDAQINYLLAHINFAPDSELESKSKSVSSYQKDIILNENNFKIGNYNYTPINYEEMSIIDLQAKQVKLQEKYNILLEKYYEEYLVKLNNKRNNYAQKLKKLVYQINNYIKQVPEIYISNKEGSLVLGFAKFKNNSLYTSDGIIIANENETYRLVTIFDNYENAIYLNYEDDYDNQEYKLSSIVSDDGNTVSLKYYNNGMLEEISSDNGQKLKFQYKTDTQTGEILEYLESIIYPDETISKYEYDNDGRLVKVIDNNDYYVKIDYLDNHIKLIEGTKYKTITGVEDSILNTNDDGTLENIERELLDIELYDYKMTKLKDRLGNTRTYLFDNAGRAVTIYDGEFNEINPSQTKISSITQEYKDNTKARSVQKIGTSKNLLNMYSDNYLSNTTYLSDELFATFYEKSADTNIYQVNSSNNNKKEVTTNNVLVNILNSGTKGYVFSAFAKADAAFTADSSMVNFEGLDKIIIDNIDELKLTRRFGLKAELTYTDNSQEILETSFDWMQTEWQYAELPIVIDENKTLSEIKLCFDYTNNIGTAKVYGFDLKEAIVEESIFNDKKQVISKTNSLLDTITTYEYDNNLLVKSTLSHNGITYTNRYTYNTQGLPIKSVDYNGNVQENEYNDKGKLIKTIKYNVNDPTTKFISETKLDEKGRKISLVDEFGRESVSYEYSKNSGLLTAEKDQNGNKLCYGYDPVNETLTGISFTADGEDNSNTFGYTLGHLTTLTHNDFNINFEYNGFGEPLAVKIDGVDGDYARFTKVSDTDELVTYASGESMETITDSKGNVTRINYTDKDAVRTTILKNTYNSEDNLISQEENIDGIKYESSYTYDKLGNQDSFTKTVTTTDTEGVETTQTLVNINKEFNEFGNITKDVVNIYNDPRINYDHSKTLTTTYNYDDSINNRLNFINLACEETQNISYDNLGRIKNISTDFLSKDISYLKQNEYGSNLVSKINYYKGDDLTDYFKYEYDKNGNISKIVNKDGDIVRYFYDNLNRLIREDNEKLAKTIVIEYNKGGNISKKTEYAYSLLPTEELTAGTSYEYKYKTTGWKDQLISYNGQAIEYDALGNPTTYKGNTFEWKLKKLVKYGSKTFNYNSNGLLNFKHSALDYVYEYDGNKLIHQGSVSDYDYFYGVEGVTGFIDNLHYMYKKNAQGDIVGIYTRNGTEVVRYVYDAWGNHKIYVLKGGVMTDADTITTYNSYKNMANDNPFRYRGYYYDTDLKLYYLQSRYYDPETGRFINADDISILSEGKDFINGLNLYAYCGNNPVMKTDPCGHAWWHNLWNNIINIFSNTISGFIDLSQNVVKTVYDFIVCGYEEGLNISNIVGDDSSPISIFVSNASSWWKFWEYQIGMRINLKNFRYSSSVGLGEINLSIETNNSSFDVQFGLNKIGLGSSQTIDKTTFYNQFYIRTLPTLALVFVAIYIQPLLPSIIKLAFI